MTHLTSVAITVIRKAAFFSDFIYHTLSFGAHDHVQH